MFKPLPDVVVTQDCENSADANYSINWEDIARWALEHGDLSGGGAGAMPQNTVAPYNGPAIDWCRVADSFMRDEAAEDVPDVCNADDINTSLRAHDHPILITELNHPSESMCQLAADGYEEFPSPIQYREMMQTPEACPRRQPERPGIRWSSSELNRTMRDSDFNNTSCYDRTPLSPMRDFSCMDADYMHDSTEDYQSDIMSYLEGRAERNRPSSIAEGYHFPGRAYGAADNDCKVYTSTPKKKQRTTRAETFEMADGSKMFNVTFEECLGFGRRLRHISDVRDTNGCQVMHMDREINEKPDGAKHRVDIARRWLDFDEGDGAGCS